MDFVNHFFRFFMVMSATDCESIDWLTNKTANGDQYINPKLSWL